MPISKTPRKVEDNNLFAPPTAQLFEDVDGENKKTVENDRVAELEDALKQLRDQREEERQDALLSQPTNWQSQVNERPVYTDPKTIQLPDPALDPDGYAVAVQRRVELASDNKQKENDHRRKFEDDIDNKTKELWSDFETEYPDISDDRERIDFVATKVVKKAVAKGLDINRYMFGSGRARFMRDVANQYEVVFGETEPEDDYEDTPRSRRSEARNTSRPRTTNRRRTEDDEGRSAGVFGGNESGGSPNRREVDNETGPSMIDDLQALQRKTGFY